jgi:hypothetical protein
MVFCGTCLYGVLWYLFDVVIIIRNIQVLLSVSVGEENTDYRHIYIYTTPR